MNIGFIGAGGVAQPHLKNLQVMPGINIAAICDLDESRARTTADEFGARVYTDYRTMLKEARLDACYVCVIPGGHGTIELDLATAGIPFYSEKPVHLNLDTCQKVLEVIDSKDLVNSVGYHWRYMTTAQAVKEFTAERKISLLEGVWYSSFVGVPWWRQMALSGGQIVEQATHVVDAARFFAGEVDTVYAAGTTGVMEEFEGYDIHDASIAILKFDSGAIGQITTGCIAEEAGGYKVELMAKGRGWFARVGAGASEGATLSDKDGCREIEEPQDWAAQLGNGDLAFIEAVKSGDSSKILSPYVSGAQTLAVTLAANESMCSGLPVKVRRFI
jgi:myo-inositol 2-dehydrogenase/D-chiro-inositol 1-dehydrogenase